jgi:hypothetical protein
MTERLRNRVGAAALIVALLSHPTATLAYNCHPPRSANSLNYQAGRIREGTSSTTYVRSIRAIVDTDEFPYVEYPYESTTFVAVTNSYQTSTNYYARMGWSVEDINEMWYFREYNGGPGTFAYRFQAAFSPEASFKIVWDPELVNGRHEFTFWYGPNHTVLSLAGHPELTWSPREGHIGARTQSRESQFPGRLANKMRMRWTQAYVNDTWVGFRTVPLTGYSTASWANFDDVANETGIFEAWDRDC